MATCLYPSPEFTQSQKSMYVYKGNGTEGVTIVNFGLSLNVTDGKATVEYNDHTSNFDDVLREGKITGRDENVALDHDQLNWLKERKTWVKRQIEDSE
jgi:hypothetical protein